MAKLDQLKCKLKLQKRLFVKLPNTIHFSRLSKKNQIERFFSAVNQTMKRTFPFLLAHQAFL
jgi:hypothetical protein